MRSKSRKTYCPPCESLHILPDGLVSLLVLRILPNGHVKETAWLSPRGRPAERGKGDCLMKGPRSMVGASRPLVQARRTGKLRLRLHSRLVQICPPNYQSYTVAERPALLGHRFRSVPSFCYLFWDPWTAGRTHRSRNSRESDSRIEELYSWKRCQQFQGRPLISNNTHSFTYLQHSR